jgi:hypothetical protein
VIRPTQPLLMPGVGAQLTAFDNEHVPRTPRRGPPRVKGSSITSVQLTPAERSLLEHVADAEGVSFGEVWRRALRLYATCQGVEITANREAATT